MSKVCERIRQHQHRSIMGNGSSSQESEAVSSLTALGFDVGEAQAALRDTHGSVERAAELLFQRRGCPAQSAPAPMPAPAPAAPAPAPSRSSYESDMERAMRESREQARVEGARKTRAQETAISGARPKTS